jgi:hypothetical protein
LYGSDGVNYDSILMRFDELGAPSPGGGSAVPEPSTLALSILGCISLLALRRRRR